MALTYNGQQVNNLEMTKGGETTLVYDQNNYNNLISAGWSAPVAPTTPPPVNRYGGAVPTNEVSEYYGGLDITPYTPEETTGVYEQQRQFQQANIDALNAIYNRQVQEAQQAGIESLGRGRSMLARGGLIGSPRGEAQQAGRREETKQAVAGIDERRALAISQIFARADDRAFQLIEAEKTRALGAEEKYIAYKQGIQAESRDDFKKLASTGNMDWDMLEEEDQQMWMKQTGYSGFQSDYIFNTYKPEAEQIKYEYVWKGNNLVGMGLDPTTGQMVETQTYSAEEMGIPREVNAGFITDKQTGDVFWYDQDNPSAGLQLMGQISPERKEYAPSSTEKEWYAAGGLEGTGMTKSEWIMKRTGMVGGGDDSLTAGQVRDIKYLPDPPKWFTDKWEKKLGWRTPQPYPTRIQEEWEAMKTEEEDEDREGTVWAWLATEEAQALSRQEKKTFIMQYRLDPQDFNIY